MLLTKPLTTFLNANRTPQVHTLLLVTPTGKLLSSGSSRPASLLRAQATIACSLWSQYTPIASSGTISSALPSDPQSPENAPADLSSILIQLENGIMVIRALRCSLLFIVIGPSPSTSISSSAHALGHELEYLALSSAVATSSPPERNNHHHLGVNGGEEGKENAITSSAASDNGSLRSTAGSGGLKVLRRQAEELARWLDTELEGFTLPATL